MIDSAEIVGRRLKALRKTAALSQDKFGGSIGLSQPRYAQYENGTRPLTLEAAASLCAVYGVTLDWLYFGDQSGLPMRLKSLSDNAA
jgi:transcriptional regulator with XRE-family HTH domain